MASDFLKERSIKYLNRDFVSLKRDLMDYSQAHHTGVFQDYNESSPGMALLELTAYVGDVLSFYQDRQFDELKRETARQVENVVSIAKQHGYRPQGKRAARGDETFFIEVPSITVGGMLVPDDTYCPIMRKGTRCAGPEGIAFETLEDLDFTVTTNASPRFVTGSRFDQNTGLPTHFAVKKNVEIIAGETKTDVFVLGSFQQFLQLELSNADVIEVLDIIDSDGNSWTEVDYLAQDTVYDSVLNNDTDSDVVPYILKLVSVPRRFVTDRDASTSKTKLIFGSGDGVNFDDELIPNLADLAIPLAGRSTFTTFALDPQNFLKTRSLGLSPFNTTVTVTYRVGGGAETNVEAKSVKTVSEAILDFSTNSLDPIKVSSVRGSLQCLNLKKTEGGGAEESISEIKANEAAFFAAQNRAVTKEDYVARVLTIPSKFGRPEKVYVKRNNINSLGLDIHILALDSNGHLTTAASNLKKNIKTYVGPYRMLTDGVNLLDSSVVNLRCSFGIVCAPKLVRSEVLAKCLTVVRDYLNVASMQIGQPISISDLEADIQSVYGVISVYELRFSNVIGTVDGLTYSSVRFDPSANTNNKILYCPENSIFEIKYATRDIVGVTK